MRNRKGKRGIWELADPKKQIDEINKDFMKELAESESDASTKYNSNDEAI